jgi:hypothetical protein
MDIPPSAKPAPPKINAQRRVTKKEMQGRCVMTRTTVAL